MNYINYFFASIISFLGLFIGILLVKIAPEEQKLLKKNFSLARKIFLLLLFLMIFHYFNSLFYLSALIAGFLFLLFIEYEVQDLYKKSTLIYAILGILFFLSSENSNLFTIESSLILLYGLPTASFMYNKKEKNN